MNFKLEKVEMSPRDIGRGVILPKKLTKELSEMIGIIVGDGHLGLYPGITKKGHKFIRSDITVSGNIKEKEYLEYVMRLFRELFNLSMYYGKDTPPGGVRIRAHSKGIIQFFNKICEIPLNRKHDIVRIPDIIKNSSIENKCSFLRGLADTDFSVVFRNKTKLGYTYPAITACFKSKFLIEDLEELYTEFGYPYYVRYGEVRPDKRFGPTIRNSVCLNGKKNFEKWLKEIGFSNPKFQRKVKKWQKDGFCPPGY